MKPKYICEKFTVLDINDSYISLIIFFFLSFLIKRLSKQSWCWWFETPSYPLWRHCNEFATHHSISRGFLLIKVTCRDVPRKCIFYQGYIPCTCSLSKGNILSSAVITLSNIVRYYPNIYRNWGRISIRCWIHKKTIPHLNGRAMGCLL